MDDREFALKLRDENQRILTEMTNTQDEIITRKLDDVNRRHGKIRARVQALQDERSELLRGEITNKEVLENAKKQLQERRSQFMQDVLIEHLKVCKYQNAKPFEGSIVGEGKLLREIVYLALTDKDIENAVSTLPDTGISKQERLAKTKKLEAEISRLVKNMTSELEEVKKELGESS